MTIACCLRPARESWPTLFGVPARWLWLALGSVVFQVLSCCAWSRISLDRLSLSCLPRLGFLLCWFLPAWPAKDVLPGRTWPEILSFPETSCRLSSTPVLIPAVRCLIL